MLRSRCSRSLALHFRQQHRRNQHQHPPQHQLLLLPEAVSPTELESLQLVTPLWYRMVFINYWLKFGGLEAAEAVPPIYCLADTLMMGAWARLAHTLGEYSL